MHHHGADHAPAHLIGLAKAPGWVVDTSRGEATVIARKDGQSFICFAEDRAVTPSGMLGASAGQWV